MGPTQTRGMHIFQEVNHLVTLVENTTGTTIDPIKPDSIPSKPNDYSDTMGMIMVTLQERIAQFVQIIDDGKTKQPYLRFSPKVDKVLLMKAVDTWCDLRSKYFIEYRYCNAVGLYYMRSLQFMLETRYLWGKGAVELQQPKDLESTETVAIH